MHLTKDIIANKSRIERLNIINSITGIKPGNLIGTRSNETGENLAIFSSVVHIGSSPALIGFILRPKGEVLRNTANNIQKTGYYTINHICSSIVKNAHYTSAKFAPEVSEFEQCDLTPEYRNGFSAPFVKESPLKIGLKFIEEIPIKRNNTSLIIGEIEHVFLPENALLKNGMIDLEKLQSVGISGLNNYYKLNKLESFPFARPNELPNFTNKANY